MARGPQSPCGEWRALPPRLVQGTVPLDNYGEIFRCFVGPAARMNLKRLALGVQFEMEPSTDAELDRNDPSP